MSAQGQDENGPSEGYARARLGAVKTPRVARPRRRRAGGLDRTCVEHRTASVDAPARPWHGGMRGCTNAPCILVTIGQESRVYHAFVTAAPFHLDAPSTMTLHVSTFAEVAGFAADEVALDEASARLAGRIVLVDTLELEWQRRRWRETGYSLAAADGTLVGLPTLQRWLWQRLKTRT
jgi:hypothetical protein